LWFLVIRARVKIADLEKLVAVIKQPPEVPTHQVIYASLLDWLINTGKGFCSRQEVKNGKTADLRQQELRREDSIPS